MSAVSMASGARRSASSRSSPKVTAPGTSGTSTRIVSFVSLESLTRKRSMTVDPLFLLQPQHALDMMLQALSDLLARSVHRQRGDIGAQAYRQVAALPRCKRASLLFEPPFEFGTCHN